MWEPVRMFDTVTTITNISDCTPEGTATVKVTVSDIYQSIKSK